MCMVVGSRPHVIMLDTQGLGKARKKVSGITFFLAMQSKYYTDYDYMIT